MFMAPLSTHIGLGFIVILQLDNAHVSMAYRVGDGRSIPYPHYDYVPNGCVNGQLTRNYKCRCKYGYEGPTCDTPVCFGGCGNGQCSSPNKCTCNPEYTGPTCDIPVCGGGCGNGQCSSPNKCTCNPGYTGPTCDTLGPRTLCPDGCVNGQCTSYKKCSCTHEYEGSTCETPVCHGGCGNGQCTSPNKCTCSPGYTGDTCDTRFCRYTEDNCDNRCEFGWHLLGSQCLTWVRQNKNGTDAKSHCENKSKNATLAQPDDIRALHEHMKKRRELVGKLDYAWYVGAEIATPGIMTWYSRGEVPAKYQDNPNAGTNGCIVLTWTDRNTPFLRSIRCSTRRWFICSKDVENNDKFIKFVSQEDYAIKGRAGPNNNTNNSSEVQAPVPAITPIYIQIKYLKGNIILKMVGSTLSDGEREFLHGQANFISSRKRRLAPELEAKWNLYDTQISKWPNAEIPILVAKNISAKERSIIVMAINEIRSKTCIKFPEYTNQREYVHIVKGDTKECVSYIGRVSGGRQILSLGDDCFSIGTVLHELMYASGFSQTQAKYHRDRKQNIHADNSIQNNTTHLNMTQTVMKYSNIPYNINSVMYYPWEALQNESPTISKKENKKKMFEQQNILSEWDVRGLNKLYDCRSRNDIDENHPISAGSRATPIPMTNQHTRVIPITKITRLPPTSPQTTVPLTSLSTTVPTTSDPTITS